MLDIFRRHYSTQHLALLSEIGETLAPSDHYAHYLRNISVSDFDPKASITKDALLLPLHAHLQIPESCMMEHGVYDNALNPIHHATHIKPLYRGFTLHPDLPKYPQYDIANYEKLPGRSYYAGILLDQFGHFTLETLTRFWHAIEMEPEGFDRVLFHVMSNRNTKNMHKRLFQDFWKDYFQVLGVDAENFVFIDRPMIAEELIVPQCSISIGVFNRSDCFISKKAQLVWRTLNERMSAQYTPKENTPPPNKIYMSRRKVDYSFRTGRIENETGIEELFRARGFHVICPEDLTSEYEKQYLLSHCRILAGPAGSGMHNSVFMKPGSHIFCITSEQMNEGVCALEHLLALGQSLGHHMYNYYQCDLDPANESKHVTVNIDPLTQALDQFVAHVTP